MTKRDYNKIRQEIEELFAASKYQELILQYLEIAKDLNSSVDITQKVANAAYLLRDLTLAKTLLEIALHKDPDNPGILHDFGLCLFKLNEFELSEEHLIKSLRLRPNYIATLLILANVLKAKKQYQEAIELYTKILEIEAFNQSALNNLATTLVKIGSYEKAEIVYMKLLSLELKNYNYYYNYANLCVFSGKIEKAIYFYRKALEIDPLNLGALNNLGKTLLQVGNFEEARQIYSMAKQAHPESPELDLNIARLDYQSGDVDRAIEEYQRMANVNSGCSIKAQINLCFALNASDKISNKQLYNHHRKLYDLLSQHVSESVIQLKSSKKIRLAYLSADFRFHSVAYFAEGIISSHDKGKFEITLYANQSSADVVTKRFQTYANSWELVAHLSDEELLDKIRSDKIDILIDLAGLTAGNRAKVFASRAAPIQINYLGYPHSSGIPNMDFRIVDINTDPLEYASLATEELIRIDPCFLVYQPFGKIEVNRSRELDSKFTFGSFNNLSKYSDTIISVWADILKDLPESRLILKSSGFNDTSVKSRLLERFKKFKLDESRVELKQFIASSDDHLSLYNQIDLALDTYPYCGTTTTCEALSMGVPVLTLTGDRHSARVGNSILKTLGHDELIANSAQEYVDKAKYFANHRPELRALSSKIRENFRSSILCDKNLFIKKWEKILLDLYQAQCK